MKMTLHYVKNIFYSHKYLAVSLPLFAFIGYVGLFIFTKKNVLDWIELINSLPNPSPKQILELSSISAFNDSIALVIFLPFIQLFFLGKLFYRSYEFTLPLQAWQKYVAYLLVAIVVFIINLLCIVFANYLLEWYLQKDYLSMLQQAFDDSGYIYQEIPKYNILHNSFVNKEVISLGSFVFFSILPFFLAAQLLFQKYSFIKSLLIAVGLIVLGRMFSTHMWSKHFTYINNEQYISIYQVMIIIIPALLCYIGFYYFFKDKEV